MGTKSAEAGVSYSAACPPRGTVEIEHASMNVGDITISTGETLIIENTTFTEIGNFIVDGGTLIVRDATLKGHAHYAALTSWILQNGGCMEFANSKDYVLDDLFVGGKVGWAKSAYDSSKLLVENSLVAISAFISSSNETVMVDDSVWQGFIYFTPFGPQNLSHVLISNSIIRNLGLTVGSGPPPIQPGHLSITGLQPGHFGYWDLQKNQSFFNVPYDLTLSNVTLIPANLVDTCYLCEGFGWTISFAPYFNDQWPVVDVSNSRLTSLNFNWPLPEPASFVQLPAAHPTAKNETLFSSITLANTTVDTYLSTSYNNSTVTYVNSAAVGLWASGFRDNVTLINSTSIDFNPWNCHQCTFSFSNASIGVSHPLGVQKIPDYQYLPNATNFWGTATAYGTMANSTVTFRGNVTFYPGECCLGGFVINSTVRRVFPTFVLGPGDVYSPNAQLVFSLVSGESVTAVTNQHGRTDFVMAFNGDNWTAPVRLGYNTTGGLRCNQTFGLTPSANVSSLLFFSKTPVLLTCSQISFTESGLPRGTKWSVSLDNNSVYVSSTNDTITFDLPDGKYSYSMASSLAEYSTLMSSGNFTVHSSNSNFSIIFSGPATTTTQQSTSPISTTSASTTSATSATQQTTTTGGGGIPEFPYQLVAATVFTVLVVASYLLVKRGRYAKHPIHRNS